MEQHFTVVADSMPYLFAGACAELPWIMLMTGANCYSQDYSQLERQLAAMGYLVAVVDQLHPIPSSISFLASKSCQNPYVCNVQLVLVSKHNAHICSIHMQQCTTRSLNLLKGFSSCPVRLSKKLSVMRQYEKL